MELQKWIESPLTEATIRDLVKESIRTGAESYPVKLNKFSFKTKTFDFSVGEYTVLLRLQDYNIISRYKGQDIEKLELALLSDVKLNCSCPDWKFGGWAYMGTQLDYATHKENRPPDINNPDLKGSICKHSTSLLVNIKERIPAMLKLIDKARGNKYNVVKP
ncbi:hypothetical protein Molly5_127 [Maribacter phage Molly_5]|nr:hypothetical protein Molly4_127 [Maribacter phage Molly_4]QQO98219.1 hypothetical protein Molly5_127 [Maribacter phage Molly_5]